MFTFIMLPVIGLLLFVGQSYSVPIATEPVCLSRYDFESKMLERMILVEHRMNMLEESTRKELDDTRREKEEMLTNGETLHNSLTEKLELKLNEITDMNRNLKVNVSNELQNVEQKAGDLENAHIKYMYDMKDVLQEHEVKMNGSIKDLQEAMSKPTSAVAFYFRDPHTSSPYRNTLLRFTTAIVNTDSVYDTSSGYFTSPTAGVYMFVVQICGYQRQYINFRIYVNDDYISDTTEYDADSANHCSSTSAVSILKQGDKVSVKTGLNTSSGNTVYSGSDYRWGTFLGVLIQPV